MAVQYVEAGVTADLTVLVPRDADGGLEGGTRTLLDRVDGVEITEVDVTGVRPRLNDLAVEATVEALVRVENGDDVEVVAREALDEGFGVTVEAVTAP